MNPLRHSRGVGANSKSHSPKVPQPCARCAWSVEGWWLSLWHGRKINWSWTRQQGDANRAQAFERLTYSERFASSTDVIECACAGGLERCAFGAGRVRSGWHVLLAGVVDWWETASVGAARCSVDDQVVQELRQDCRSGVVAWRGCRTPVVHQSKWSGGDASCCETDRADGCAEHGLDVTDGIHPFGSSASRSSRDKGGK